MPTQSHTPGPWKIDGCRGSMDFADHCDIIIRADNWAIANAFESEANARLIAAAPDLLAALEGLVEQHRKALADLRLHHPNGWQWGEVPCLIAEDTIAKAKGVSNV